MVRRYIILLSLLVVFATGCGSGGATGSSSLTIPPSGSDSNNTATLSWGTPSTYSNGDPLVDLSGYRVYYGTEPGNYSNSLDVGDTNTYTITDLDSGKTYYFAVTAYNSASQESDFSDEVTKSFI